VAKDSNIANAVFAGVARALFLFVGVIFIVVVVYMIATGAV
jgi:hypothetical protein